MNEPAHVSVRLLEKDYLVACPPEQRAELLDSAEYLNSKMREIRESGKVVGLDRVAVMAALNITHELLRARREAGLSEDIEDRLRQMRERLETAMATDGRQLEF